MPNAELIHLAGVLASAFTLIGGIIWWLLKRHLNKVQRENRILRDKLAKANKRNEELELELKKVAEAQSQWQAEKTQMEATQHGLKKQIDAVKAENANFAKHYQRAKVRAEQLEQQLHQRVEAHTNEVAARDEQLRLLKIERDEQHKRATQAETDASLLDGQLKHLNAQLEEVIKQDERVWERPVSGPAFVSLIRRDVPIIAVLNLKGGVGKTTITANLAGLMAQQGKRVLVIDADYQRNLSMLLKSDKDRKMLHLEGKTLQHFLKNPSNSLDSLLLAASEVTGMTDCRIVTNSDSLNAPAANSQSTLEDISLEDVEMRMMAGWMFRQTGADIRLQLREALHDQALKEKGYRYVLIDCPPRLSTACINALAACDFFIVPVLLDATSARSVPNLLRTLNRLRTATIFPHLKCLGIVANGVTFWKEKLIVREGKTWKELPPAIQPAWKSPVHLFNTMVPHSARFAEAAGPVFGHGDSACLALGDTEIKQVFTSLLKEINTRIEHESKHPATVST